MAFVYWDLLAVPRLVEHLTYFQDFLAFTDEQNCEVTVSCGVHVLPCRERDT